jgi:hypothetical protein
MANKPQPPRPKITDFIRNTQSGKESLSPDKPTLSAARRRAIANMKNPSSTSNASGRRTKGRLPEDTGQTLDPVIDSPLGRRLKEGGKKNPFLRVN